MVFYSYVSSPVGSLESAYWDLDLPYHSHVRLFRSFGTFAPPIWATLVMSVDTSESGCKGICLPENLRGSTDKAVQVITTRMPAVIKRA